VTREVRARYPSYFEDGNDHPSHSGSKKDKPITPGKKQAGAVRGGKKTFTRNDLTEEMQEAMSSFVKTGIMTEAEFIEQQVAAGNLS
jgi:hypothetical protein